MAHDINHYLAAIPSENVSKTGLGAPVENHVDTTMSNLYGVLVIASVGAADRGWKFKAALAGEEFVIIKGDDGKPYAAKVEVSA